MSKMHLCVLSQDVRHLTIT